MFKNINENNIIIKKINLLSIYKTFSIRLYLKNGNIKTAKTYNWVTELSPKLVPNKTNTGNNEIKKNQFLNVFI